MKYDKISLAVERETLLQLSLIKELLAKLLRALLPVEQAKVIEFYATINGELTKVEHMFLKVSENLPLSLAIKDSQGNPARVDGAPQWSVTDGSLATLTVAEDGLSATLSPSGPIGSFSVQVRADADLGEGVKELLGELSVDLVSGEAVSLEISAGTPEPKA